MGIGPARTKRTDRAVQGSVGRQGLGLLNQVKRRVGKIQQWVDLLRIDRGCQRTSLQLFEDLDDAGHPRRRLQVPDVTFDRTDSN
ncbi:hypothetical protein D3C76_699790 [compost metagenome]